MKYFFTIILFVCFYTKGYSQFILNKDASTLSTGCIQLTPNSPGKVGSAWYNTQIDLSESFDLHFDAYFGASNSGADGMTFSLQPVGTSVGTTGAGLGMGGITPAISVEFDTYQNGDKSDPWEDHVAIMKNGNMDHGSSSNLAGPVQTSKTKSNVEDNTEHAIRIHWDITTLTLTVYVDCELRVSYTGDIVTDIFSGNPLVYWGFTGATGALYNKQYFCMKYTDAIALPNDTLYVCEGDSVQLNATLGSGYEWLLDYNITDITIQNPEVFPTEDTTYTVNILDPCGFPTKEAFRVEVSKGLAILAITDSIKDVSCFGSTDGEILVEASGGIAHKGYTFTLTAPDGSTIIQSSPKFIGLGPGLYTVNVSDTTSCFADVDITIIEPLELMIDTIVHQNSCVSTNNSEIILTITGGAAPYTYSTDGTTFDSPSLKNLTAGTYTITVKDANNCLKSIDVTITSPTISTNLIANNCFGDTDGSIEVLITDGYGTYTYSIDGITYTSTTTFSGLISGDYTVYVQSDKGCIDTIKVKIDGPTEILDITLDSKKDVLCYGESSGEISVNSTGGTPSYQYSINSTTTFGTESNFTALTAGKHIVYVKDNNGCLDSLEVELTEPTAIMINSLDTTNITCFGNQDGEIIINATGGTGILSYQLNGGSLQTSNIFASLSAGTYLINCVDENGCAKDTTIILVEPLQVIAEFTALETVGNIPFVVTFTNNSSGATSYNWDFGDGNTSTEENPTHTYDSIGFYQIVLTAQNDNGCTDTFSINLQAVGEAIVIIPDAFTPNEDDLNDLFVIKGKNFVNLNIIIFDRWGEVIYKTFHEEGINWEGWDGIYKGQKLPNGSYPYVINYGQFGNPGKITTLRGKITIVR